MTTEYDPPLVHLPGTQLTPEVVLHRTLNKINHIKAVAVVIQWDDDSFDTDYSLMSVAELSLASRMLDKLADDVIFGRKPENMWKERD